LFDLFFFLVSFNWCGLFACTSSPTTIWSINFLRSLFSGCIFVWFDHKNEDI
jgi:hypothetical protein